MREVQASVARCLRTPPYAAKRKDLVSATRTAYAARAIAGARLLLATVHFGPITVVPHRDKANPFRRSSILFRPHDPPTRGSGGAAGYRPRVRSDYYERVYVHSPDRSGRSQYMSRERMRQGRRCRRFTGRPAAAIGGATKGLPIAPESAVDLFDRASARLEDLPVLGGSVLALVSPGLRCKGREEDQR